LESKPKHPLPVAADEWFGNSRCAPRAGTFMTPVPDILLRRLFPHGLSELRKKQLSALAMFCWCYVSLTFLGLFAGFSAALAANELGSFETWASRIHLTCALLILVGMLTVSVAYSFLMWRLRRYVSLMLTMLYYGAKALLLFASSIVLSRRRAASAFFFLLAVLILAVPRHQSTREAQLPIATEYGRPAWLAVSEAAQGRMSDFRVMPFLANIGIALAAGIVAAAVLAAFLTIFFAAFGIKDLRKHARGALVKGLWVQGPDET